MPADPDFEAAELAVRARLGLPADAAELAERDDAGEFEFQTDEAKTLKMAALFAPDNPTAYLLWLECEARTFVATVRFRAGFAALFPVLLERGEVTADRPPTRGQCNRGPR